MIKIPIDKNKYNEKELLKWLDKCWSLYKTSQDEWKKSEQAYQQIKEMVKLHFSDDWQQVKKELGKFMQKQKLGHDEKTEQKLQEIYSDKKPKVTEEWIEEKAKDFILKANIAIQNPEAYRQQLEIAKDFIHSLIEEIK